MSPLPILAVLPALNEATRIAPVIQKCARVVEKVLVVDDGSTDETAKISLDAGAQVIQHPQNRGKGAAIQTAFDAFKKDSLHWLCLLDSDGQHDPEDIPAMHEMARAGSFDVIVGNRMEETKDMPIVRIATNRFMSGLLSGMCRQRIPDTQCGFRLFSRAVIETLKFTTTHYDLESEMLIQLARQGFRIGSCRIKTIYGDGPSHINPIVDTVRFFRLIHRYLAG
ncbi:MAG: glycosyltransferase family 2 protein [Verrucomicrobiae bacterium]|nr:glycosyltransferase family 2 protein [Verrucomicrobiae bacterium]